MNYWLRLFLNSAPLDDAGQYAGDQKPPIPFCVAIKLSRDADRGVSGAKGFEASAGCSPLVEVKTGG